MKIREIFAHIAIIAGGLFLLVLAPLTASGAFAPLFGGADAVASASVLVDQSSGEYVIYINRDMHPDKEKLSEWITFFSGGEISYIFEDIICSVAKGDPGGRQMADSFRSRLPENQMRIDEEDGALLLSRADAGLFDILILSREAAELLAADSGMYPETERIEIRGGMS